ncbi:hypothetical protein OTU49_016617 [Cherax quadricarinatus]|uniref:Uncharacterized protein n=1 Tax=Cherax quadricarinatus TaxID=27406 RepID=A0AAW0Y4V3_CHEQU
MSSLQQDVLSPTRCSLSNKISSLQQDIASPTPTTYTPRHTSYYNNYIWPDNVYTVTRQDNYIRKPTHFSIILIDFNKNLDCISRHCRLLEHRQTLQAARTQADTADCWNTGRHCRLLGHRQTLQTAGKQ